MGRTHPPGPCGRLFGIPFYRSFADNPLGFTERIAREYGDFAYVRIGWARIYFVHRPALIREVLATKVKSFQKLGRQMRSLRKIEGDGLVVAEGETWARHRPVVQGSFHNRHFGRYADVIVDYTRRRLNGWTAGQPFDLATEMNELALEIIAKLVFDTDLSGQAARLRDAVHSFRAAMQREANSPIPPPDWLPLPSKFRQRRAIKQVDDLIWAHIRERRAAGSTKDDILAQMLKAASVVHPDNPISDAEIRDEASTLFVAGHDTTSAALAWFWYVLTRNPEVERRALAEVDYVVGDRRVTGADFGQLRFLEMIVKESMRLYPVAGFLFGREAVEDVELGGHQLGRGSWVMIAPYVVHRDPRNFSDPETFDPDRFSTERIGDIPAYAYIPFGGGPRTCIGNALATMQIVLMAATVLQRFRVSLEQGPPQIELEIVLRPKGGLRAKVTPRTPAERLPLAG